MNELSDYKLRVIGVDYVIQRFGFIRGPDYTRNSEPDTSSYTKLKYKTLVLLSFNSSVF